jgi:hypothetical protein
MRAAPDRGAPGWTMGSPGPVRRDGPVSRVGEGGRGMRSFRVAHAGAAPIGRALIRTVSTLTLCLSRPGEGTQLGPGAADGPVSARSATARRPEWKGAPKSAMSVEQAGQRTAHGWLGAASARPRPCHACRPSLPRSAIRDAASRIDAMPWGTQPAKFGHTRHDTRARRQRTTPATSIRSATPCRSSS